MVVPFTVRFRYVTYQTRAANKQQAPSLRAFKRHCLRRNSVTFLTDERQYCLIFTANIFDCCTSPLIHRVAPRLFVGDLLREIRVFVCVCFVIRSDTYWKPGGDGYIHPALPSCAWLTKPKASSIRLLLYSVQQLYSPHTRILDERQSRKTIVHHM